MDLNTLQCERKKIQLRLEETQGEIIRILSHLDGRYAAMGDAVSGKYKNLMLFEVQALKAVKTILNEQLEYIVEEINKTTI